VKSLETTVSEKLAQQKEQAKANASPKRALQSLKNDREAAEKLAAEDPAFQSKYSKQHDKNFTLGLDKEHNQVAKQLIKQKTQQKTLDRLLKGAMGSETKANEYIAEMASVRNEIKRLKKIENSMTSDQKWLNKEGHEAILEATI